jgi:hypothetical protein
MWVAVDKNGLECSYDSKPRKIHGERWFGRNCQELTKGFIYTMIGIHMSFSNPPVNIDTFDEYKVHKYNY